MKKVKKLVDAIRSAAGRESLTAVRGKDLVNALGGSSKDASGPGLACGHYEYDCPA